MFSPLLIMLLLRPLLPLPFLMSACLFRLVTSKGCYELSRGEDPKVTYLRSPLYTGDHVRTFADPPASTNLSYGSFKATFTPPYRANLYHTRPSGESSAVVRNFVYEILDDDGHKMNRWWLQSGDSCEGYFDGPNLPKTLKVYVNKRDA
jgi:hypothetical protein